METSDYFRLLEDIIERINKHKTEAYHIAEIAAIEKLAEQLKDILVQIGDLYRKIFPSIEPVEYENDSIMRAIRSHYQAIPLSWEGSNCKNGRFNEIGQPTLYFAEQTEIILKELPPSGFTNYQHTIFPTEIRLSKILDLENESQRTMLGTGLIDLLREEWAPFLDLDNLKPLTHIISDLARAHGFEAIRYESRLDGRYNLAVFPKNIKTGSILKIKDPQPGQELVELTFETLHLFVN